MLYSKEDGNILISLRHENIVYKVDYEDGKGTGTVSFGGFVRAERQSNDGHAYLLLP